MPIKTIATILPASSRAAFWQGFALSAAVGLGIIFILSPLAGVSREFGYEGHDGYWQIACNLARGNGFVFDSGGPPELNRPPVAPLLFAPLTLLPESIQRAALVLLQSFLVGAACAFMFDLASRTGGNRIAGLAVGILLFYPWIYWHVKNPMNILAQMLAIVAALDLIAGEFFQPEKPVLGIRFLAHSPIRLILAGLAAAMAILTHGTALPAMALILSAIFAAGVIRRNRHCLLVAVIPGIIAAAVIAPWTCRNWQVTHRFVPVVHSAGFAYFLGSVHWGFGVENQSPASEYELVFAAAGLEDATNTVRFCGVTDVKVANALGERMTEDMKSHPARLLAKISLNALEFYFPVIHDLLSSRRQVSGFSFTVEKIAVSIWNLTLWVLAFIGLWKAKDGKTRFTLCLIIFCITAFNLPYLPVIAYIGHAQYSAPLIPLLAILAAHGLPFRDSGAECNYTE